VVKKEKLAKEPSIDVFDFDTILSEAMSSLEDDIEPALVALQQAADAAPKKEEVSRPEVVPVSETVSLEETQKKESEKKTAKDLTPKFVSEPSVKSEADLKSETSSPSLEVEDKKQTVQEIKPDTLEVASSEAGAALVSSAPTPATVPVPDPVPVPVPVPDPSSTSASAPEPIASPEPVATQSSTEAPEPEEAEAEEGSGVDRRGSAISQQSDDPQSEGLSVPGQVPRGASPNPFGRKKKRGKKSKRV
jgi:hypothetical protein